MIDPLVASDGQTYEIKAIESIIKSADPESPLPPLLLSNLILKNIISERLLNGEAIDEYN